VTEIISRPRHPTAYSDVDVLIVPDMVNGANRIEKALEMERRGGAVKVDR
jgi:hypothetical protein